MVVYNSMGSPWEWRPASYCCLWILSLGTTEICCEAIKMVCTTFRDEVQEMVVKNDTCYTYYIQCQGNSFIFTAHMSRKGEVKVSLQGREDSAIPET